MQHWSVDPLFGPTVSNLQSTNYPANTLTTVGQSLAQLSSCIRWLIALSIIFTFLPEFNGLFSRSARVSQFRSVSSSARSRRAPLGIIGTGGIVGQMSPSQQCQSSEGNSYHWSRPHPLFIYHQTSASSPMPAPSGDQLSDCIKYVLSTYPKCVSHFILVCH